MHGFLADCNIPLCFTLFIRLYPSDPLKILRPNHTQTSNKTKPANRWESCPLITVDRAMLCLLGLNTKVPLSPRQLPSAGWVKCHTPNSENTIEEVISSWQNQKVEDGLFNARAVKQQNQTKKQRYWYARVNTPYTDSIQQAHCWILCGIITGPKKRKVNIWAGFGNYRLTVIKLPRMTSEWRGFKIFSSLRQCVEGRATKVKAIADWLAESVIPALLNSCLTSLCVILQHKCSAATAIE